MGDQTPHEASWASKLVVEGDVLAAEEMEDGRRYPSLALQFVYQLCTEERNRSRLPELTFEAPFYVEKVRCVGGHPSMEIRTEEDLCHGRLRSRVEFPFLFSNVIQISRLVGSVDIKYPLKSGDIRILSDGRAGRG